MFLSLLLLHLGGTDPGTVYNGRSGSLEVRPPRLEAGVKVDGMLDESAWAQAAMLTGFSQFTPLDGIPAADSTEVLVWYSPDAIHFGVRAYEPHGEVHATLADRDKIGSDDFVQFFLGTFDDGRQATVLASSPTSPPRARCSSPDTAARCATRSTPTIRFVPGSGGRRTGFSSR